MGSGSEALESSKLNLKMLILKPSERDLGKAIRNCLNTESHEMARLPSLLGDVRLA